MPRPKVSCPGCGQPKTATARTCASCRQRALDVGLQAVLEKKLPTERSADEEKRFDRSRRAYNGKADALAKELGVTKREIKDRTMHKASQHFGRPITSFNELALIETGWVLDQLEEQLDALDRVGVDA